MDRNERKENATIKILNEIEAIKPIETSVEKSEKMVSEIEREQSSRNDDDDVGFEYFVDRKRKFYVPTHHQNLFNTKDDIMLLQAENMILRLDIKKGMARRISELEENEFWMQSEISTLKAKNEKLGDYVKNSKKRSRTYQLALN